MSVWHPFIRWQRFTMTMVMVMMMIMVVIVMVTATMAVVMVMVMMVMIMMVMMFAMAVVMGVFVFHIFIHNKPPRGLRRPTNNNKKTYSTFMQVNSTSTMGFKSYLQNMF